MSGVLPGSFTAYTPGTIISNLTGFGVPRKLWMRGKKTLLTDSDVNTLQITANISDQL